MRKMSLVFVLTLIGMLTFASAAFAAHAYFDETAVQTYLNKDVPGYAGATGCSACHAGASYRTVGPHGGYTSTTNKCTACHTVHSKAYGDSNRTAANAKLLPGATVTAACNFCHDLTAASRAPYNTAYLTGEGQIQAAHDVEGITWTFNGSGNVDSNTYAASTRTIDTTIPGGNSAGGGTIAYAGLFQQGDLSNNSVVKFTCNSCHTPHAITGSVVNAYIGESKRLNGGATTRLLKKTLTVGGEAYANYSSEWCSGCHMGRMTKAGETVFNHPVKAEGKPYLTEADKTAYNAAATALGLGNTIAGATARETNAWYSMTLGDPLTPFTGAVGQVDAGNGLNARPDGYIPISQFQSDVIGENGPSCQQCHASPRDVEQAYAFTYGNESRTMLSDTTNGNPWAQTFPHVSNNKSLLVENNDDFCTNCHGLDNLP